MEGDSLLSSNGHLDPSIAENFGKKTITSFSSYALLLNNITGPGLVAICIAYQHGGWLPATVILLAAALGSAISAGFLVETMTHFKGNDRFQGRVEFLEMARALFPEYGYYFVFFLFLFNITTSNVSAILESAQTLDQTFLMGFGQVCALELHPELQFICVEKSSSKYDSVFGEIWYVSSGFVCLAAISVPVGLWNLEENMIIQASSFVALLVLLTEFSVQFMSNGLHPEYLPDSALSSGSGVSLGSILFNFAFVVTVPSWVNEKRPDVNIHKTLWSSITTGTFLFILMGLVGAMAYKFPHGADLLTKLSHPNQWIITRVFAQLFPPLVLVPGIPILSIIMRYNLLENRICGPMLANLIAVFLPWMLALLTMSGNLLNVILNWTGLLTVGPLNFLIPCAMFLISEHRNRNRSNGGSKLQVMSVSEKDEKLVAASKGQEAQAYGSLDDENRQTDEETEPWRFLSNSSRRGAMIVAYSVIATIGLLNVFAVFLAIRGIFIHNESVDPNLPPPTVPDPNLPPPPPPPTMPTTQPTW
eukprot:CAMPEP_0114538878 /NCGR_PEP_ID=MMETSP0109-20121206/30384_1 /TAXON_ID=29199 /ORGANISM="Chlorarachnion reptans, Strain CCCM449" /LENGTH=532 /DNA_ID=CAMNT_0001722939 /DNA_START=166 /DNA_END=1761 /DNA_ORIENTATION=+